MIAGLAGSLFAHDAIEGILATSAIPELTCEAPPAAARHLRAVQTALRSRLGPSSGPRLVFDLVGEPLANALGFGVVPVSGGSETVDALLLKGSIPAAVMIVTAWDRPAASVWRHAVHRGLAHDTRWCISVSGSAIRLFDVGRAYSRRYAEFNLEAALDSPQTVQVLWGLLRADALIPGPGGAVLDRAVALSEQHRAQVRRSLRDGVQDALLQLITGFRRAASLRHPDSRVLDESLTVLYRILFLLFAEARGLVPSWHPVYRDGYTIEALRRQLRDRAMVGGVWEALQAVARLAHRGCRAGTLRVPPFNGRLFSPSDAPLADTVPLDDSVVARALLALTTRKGANGPERISYTDLGVEQLGSVYEHLLDYDLSKSTAKAPAILIPTGRRKATGSFYTPRSLTEFLVRRTLAPVVQDAASDRILSLRILDPAMGSGAFLVAACRYLASAYEQALLREGVLMAGDVCEDDRAGFRRTVAQRCLFGVDANPMAVHLGRLSLWLATLAADKPLSFLDHRLRSGNSLVGASLEDILRHPAPGSSKRSHGALPLFQIDELQSRVEQAVSSRLSMAATPDDTLEQVRHKERSLASLDAPGGPLDRWKAAADIWCAAWYPGSRRPDGRGIFGAILDQILQGSSALPPHVSGPLIERARTVAAGHRFFHWPFEFPEIFYDELGAPRPDSGFDVIVGNPPWEMLRNDGASARAAEMQGFVRGSGLFALQGTGHLNLYQLFLERSIRLLRREGRAGLILPAGVSTDHGVTALRRFLFERTTIDTFTTLDNRDGIFPIHRSLKFLLLTFTKSGSTGELPSRTGVRSPEVLDAVPDTGFDPQCLRVPRTLLERTGGHGFAVPELRAPLDLEILASVSFRVPALGDPAGWGLHFGRELNATDDRPHFGTDAEGLPVLEGKQLQPFVVHRDAVRYWIAEQTAGRLLNPTATYRRHRLAYRDVASATNRTTLIAAIVPAGIVTTHTIFCLKEPLEHQSQLFLCGVFNSYVANYLIRMQVGTHVTAAIVGRLPVPRLSRADRVFRRVARLSGSLARRYSELAAARLNGAVAKMYALTPTQFEHVLSTFPLVAEAERAAAFRAFTDELR